MTFHFRCTFRIIQWRYFGTLNKLPLYQSIDSSSSSSSWWVNQSNPYSSLFPPRGPLFGTPQSGQFNLHFTIYLIGLWGLLFLSTRSGSAGVALCHFMSCWSAKRIPCLVLCALAMEWDGFLLLPNSTEWLSEVEGICRVNACKNVCWNSPNIFGNKFKHQNRKTFKMLPLGSSAAPHQQAGTITTK